MEFHTPSDDEERFLRIVVRGHRELEVQIASCMISAYDPTGWYTIRALAGPESPIRYRADTVEIRGLDPETGKRVYIGAAVSIDGRGKLQSIEIAVYEPDDASALDPVALFAAFHARGDVRYLE